MNRRKMLCFRTQHMHCVQKQTNVSHCRQRCGHSPGSMSDVQLHCVTRVMNRRYAVTHPEGNLASGRAIYVAIGIKSLVCILIM